MSKLPADWQQREQALDPRRSFIVQAPAGSGKTELLVQRFLALLATVERPEEVVAITFTRKAAAEMRKRVLAGLARITKPRWTLADIGQRLRIQTIDALCTALTRQMPVLARFGAQPETIENADELYRMAAQRTLALLEAGDAVAADIAQLLSHRDGDMAAVENLLTNMLKRRDQWLRQTGRHGAAPDRAALEAVLAAERARLVAKARMLYPEASPEFAQRVLTKKGEWKKHPPAPPELLANEPLRVALAALLSLPPGHYTDAQWKALGAIIGLLPRAAAELKLVFVARGQVDFTEIAQGALRALGDADTPSDLLLSFDARISHLLVDEFQDTSISQWELLERLTAGWEVGDGRTVFVVGDPMQSIYRFRGAEVGLFLRTRQRGIGSVALAPLTLYTNFRSQAGIIEWVNAAFAQILPRDEDEIAGVVSYSPAVPQNALLPGTAVRWHGFFDEDKGTARAAEARRVVEIINTRRSEQPRATIAVLVRNRSALEFVVPALKQAKLRFRAIEIEHLEERQVVQDLLALTRTLLHPADRIAWLTLLRAPWCGLGLEDLSRLVEEAATQTVWELMEDEIRLATLSSDGRRRLARVRVPLAAALAQRLRSSLRARVEGVWLALGGPACVVDATALEDVEVFLDHLEMYEMASDLDDLAKFEDSLDKLYGLPDVCAGDDAIEVMTIHKAKGLEFDTVIVPGLDRMPAKSEPPLLVWQECSDETLLLAPIKAASEQEEPIYDYIWHLQKTAEDAEARRLLYVAATRAQSRLHLLACIGVENADDNATVLKLPAKRSLLAKAWPVAAAEFSNQLRSRTPAATARVSSPATVDGAQTILRLAADWVLPDAPAAVRWHAPLAECEWNEIEFLWVGETARHIGSVVHRWLQRIADDELEGWDIVRITKLHGAITRELASRGVAANDLLATTSQVLAALTRTITDERGRWLLGPQRNARNEHRITARIGGDYVDIVVDRTFLDTAGRRWIVDYKTSTHEGADVEGFLDRERIRYESQLARYAAALGAGGKTLLGLYFPLLGGWREWSA